MWALRSLPTSPDSHASDPVLVHWLAFLLHASFRPRLAATPLRFAITSPLSGCEEDLHLQAVEHARRTNEKGGGPGRPASFYPLSGNPASLTEGAQPAARWPSYIIPKPPPAGLPPPSLPENRQSPTLKSRPTLISDSAFCFQKKNIPTRA